MSFTNGTSCKVILLCCSCIYFMKLHKSQEMYIMKLHKSQGETKTFQIFIVMTCESMVYFNKGTPTLLNSS